MPEVPLRLVEARRHRGRLLDLQIEAAARGRFEGLLGGVVDAVARQPATGRCKREGARAHATHPWAKEGVAAVHAGWRGRGWQRRQASNVLCVCAGCVWAVRVQDWFGAHAGNGWSRSKGGRGGVETRPRRGGGGDMHGMVNACQGPWTHGRVGSMAGQQTRVS